MEQKILNIAIKDLHLWTENPRDPIGEDINDLEIIKRAINDNEKKWNIPKLIRDMGDYYHFNKLPIVVLKDKKYIVYDGNCRVTILKYLQNPEWSKEIEGTLFPSNEPTQLKNLLEIPCNLCDEDTALDIIYRDNISNNTWSPLTQHYFEHYYLKKEKSTFLMFEETTNLISSHDKLNQRFVADEVITKLNLESIGFRIVEEKLQSIYSNQENKEILERLIELIETGKIKTRTDEKKWTVRVSNKTWWLKWAMEKLSPDLKNGIKNIDKWKPKEVNTSVVWVWKTSKWETSHRKTSVKESEDVLFGRKLLLKEGMVNNLYCAIDEVYDKFKKNKNFEYKLPFIGMSLRLILDIAGREVLKDDTEKAYKNFLSKAKKEMWMSKKSQAFLAVTDNWLDAKGKLEGTFAKYAHWTMPVDKGNIIISSKIVADILEYYFKR